VLLQPAVLAAFVLALWRFGTDPGWTQEFVISTGAFSHWQTWIAIAFVLQVAVIALNRYGNVKPLPKSEEPDRQSILKSEFDRVL
jgi:choline-glycine betaine transporter